LVSDFLVAILLVSEFPAEALWFGSSFLLHHAGAMKNKDKAGTGMQ